MLDGRCRHCHARISPRYVIVELLCGLLFLLCLLLAGPSVYAVKGCVLCFLLLGLIFTDAETHLLPDALTLPGLGVALILSFFAVVPGPASYFFPIFYPTRYGFLQIGLRSLTNSLLGAAVGSGALYAVGWLYLKLRKVDGMGLGDVKLMAMVGAFLGPALTLFVLCSSSLLGGIYGIFVLISVLRSRLIRYRARSRTQASSRAWQSAQTALRGLEIPFGVFLGFMSILTWFFGAQMIRAYLDLLLIAD